MRLNPELQPAELQRKIRSLDNREHLLLIGAVAFAVFVGVGLIVAVLPDYLRKPGISGVSLPRLSFIFIGFIALSVIVARFLNKQRQALSDAREELVRTALGVEGVENLGLIDPLTGLLNRQYFDRFTSKDTALAERTGLSLTFLMIEAREKESPNGLSERGRLGIADVLRKNFRGSDTVVRYSDVEFVVSMVGCNERQAQEAAKRLLTQLDRWNRADADGKFEISLRYSTASYAKGLSIATLMETLRQKMAAYKCEQPTAEPMLS